MTQLTKDKIYWAFYAIAVIAALMLFPNCGSDENGTQTQNDGGTFYTDTQDAATMVSDTKPGSMAGKKDAASISEKRDSGMAVNRDTMPVIPVFDGGNGPIPLACFSRNCAYPDVGCCWIDDDHTLCNTSASCSVPGWEIFGCKCEVKK